MNRRWIAIGTLPLLVLGAAVTQARAQGRDVDRVQLDMVEVETALRRLTAEAISAEPLDPAARFQRRLTDAEILYLLGDPMRASLILYELVADQKHKREPLYSRALYYLAESLFLMKHDLSAREFFQELVQRRDSEHLIDAVRRLIQIADRTERFEGLEEHVSVLRAEGPLPPDIAYILGKSLVQRGKSEEGRTVARGVPQSHRLYAKAQYLVAVAEVQLGRYGVARQVFEQLVNVDPQYEEATRIRALAAMNRGRILLEQGDLPGSVSAYQAVDAASPLFEQALYEATWSYVRSADKIEHDKLRALEYQKAQRSLEILLLSNAETPLIPEARLLYGNILLRLGRFDDATSAFKEVVDRYGPVRGELTGMLAEVDEPAAYYEEVVSRGKMGDSLLPPLAMRWAENEEPLQKAMRVVGDLTQGDSWIDESNKIIDKLLAILDSDRRYSFFPKLQELQGRSLEIGNSLVSLNQRLLAAHRELAYDALTADKRAELDALLAERMALEPKYRALPQRMVEYEGRAAEQAREIARVEKQVFRLRFEIESMRAQIRALNQWLAANPNQLSAKNAEVMRERIEQQTAVITELETLQRGLAAEVEKDRELVAATHEGGEDARVRKRYQELLEREQLTLESATPRLKGSQSALLGVIEQTRAKLASFNAELSRFNDTLEQEVGSKASELKADVLRERGELEALANASRDTRGEAERVVGEVAQGSIGQVERKFRDILLRADVGIIDVAWAIKEQQTQEINRRVGEQRRELEILDSEFQEVLAE